MTAITSSYLSNLAAASHKHLTNEVAPRLDAQIEAGEWERNSLLPPYVVANLLVCLFSQSSYRNPAIYWDWYLVKGDTRLGHIRLVEESHNVKWGLFQATGNLLLLAYREGTVEAWKSQVVEPGTVEELLPKVERFIEEVYATL